MHRRLATTDSNSTILIFFLATSEKHVSVKEFHSLTLWIDKHIAFKLVRDCSTTNELVLRVL